MVKSLISVTLKGDSREDLGIKETENMAQSRSQGWGRLSAKTPGGCRVGTMLLETGAKVTLAIEQQRT